MSVGRKFDSGKAPLVQGCLQYFPNALAAVAQVSDFGRRKYDTTFEARNWYDLEGGLDRYTDALGRHITTTDTYDSESQLLHRAHAAWDALAALELALSKHHHSLRSGLPDILEERPAGYTACTGSPTCTCPACDLPF